METKFQKIKKIVEEEMSRGKDPSHDIDHVMRVYNLALYISKEESGVDQEVLRAAVLLHDIGSAEEINDLTGQTDHAVVGAKMAQPILESLSFSDAKIKHIQDCILSHRYRTDYKPKTIEAKIVYDADKLDTVGAVGVARVFAWAGKHQAKIYKKVYVPKYIKENQDGKLNGRIQDKSKHSAHINYEVKDKFLLDNLYTKTAKKIGRKKLLYYKAFLDQLEREINPSFGRKNDKIRSKINPRSPDR
jgi:uncharacterized protein